MPPRRRRTQPRTVDRAAPDFSLESVIESMRDEHVQCRDFSHSWRPFTASQAPDGHYEQVLRCSRCRTLRKRLLDRRGAVVSSAYEYADGYVVKGLGRINGSERDHLRLVSIRKVLEGRRDDASG